MNLILWRQMPASVKWLLAFSFLMNMGFYALIPYLSLHLTGSFGWSVALTGLLLAVRQLTQQGLSFLGGIAGDRFGYKGALVFGVVVRGIGFASFAFCDEIWEFFVAAVLSGLGGSLFEPASSAAYGILTPEEIRKEVFAFRNVLTNIGIVGSQVVGIVLATVDFVWLSLFAGGLYFLIGLMAFLFIPAMNGSNKGERLRDSLAFVLRDRLFLRFTALLIGYYYLYMQLFLAIPQFVEDRLGTWAVGVVLATVSVTTVLFQMKLIQWLEGFPRYFTLIGAGTMVMGVGLWMLSFADSLWLVLLDVTVFSLGTMISVPYMVDLVPVFAPKERLGAYYGFNAYGLAFGGSIGTFAGGWMYDLGETWQMSWLPWTICLAIGVGVGWSLHRMEGCLGERTENKGLT